ncbi:NADH dehydrogenase [ubiquinone] 1 subunit C1, mitochondrial [Microcaecilia unicolor]|uniref:NADH dehydrogenase [ubiquinone] 1 subunit C1, mitochondrial n=1 Tax=Microcaecilia unicolor TaxID=1415580 RepID=A0A6P7WWL3_9AMPH|nr:NADH dehydrogenase [ubiquinone] 1 subunit C1, mitochondrial [Microcaecilia unicolor]
MWLTGMLFRAPVALRNVQTRSMFLAKKPDYSRPNWLRVSLAFGTSAFLWVTLFRQHQYDLAECERRLESSTSQTHEIMDAPKN